MPGAHVKATKPPFGHDLGEYFATVSFAEAHVPVPPSPSAKTNLVVIGAKGAGPGGGDATAGGGGLFATVLEEEDDMEPAASAQASMAIRCSGWERSMVLDGDSTRAYAERCWKVEEAGKGWEAGRRQRRTGVQRAAGTGQLFDGHAGRTTGYVTGYRMS